MDAPIRSRVYVEKEKVWVPPLWRSSRVLLYGASAEEQGPRDITEAVRFGVENPVVGAPDTAYIEEASQLRFTGLQARPVGEDRLAVQVGLAGQAPPHPVQIVLTLTGAGGREIGHSEVVLGRKARSVAVEVKVPARLRGQVRLKATLCIGEQIADNCRTVVEI
jgi:hypothetical protein